MTIFVNSLAMTDKQTAILDAAWTVFLRYGYRRVTMADLAQAASMSRPALYLVFANKDELFRALVERFCARTLTRIHDECRETSGLAEQLTLAFELWVVEPYLLIMQSPDARDLVEVGQGVASEVIQQACAAFESGLLAILQRECPVAPANGPSLAEIARILARSAHGFKFSAETVDDLRAMIRGQLALALIALGQPPYPSMTSRNASP